ALGASINLIPYSLYAKLSLETLKPTKISIRLADRSFQYPVGIAENMLVEVSKFTFLVDFVILEMEEDSKVPLILGRPFLHTADAVIRVKQKQLNLGIRTERMIFNIDSAMKHSYSNNDTCFSIDVIDEILEEYFDALLDEGSKILHSIEGTYLEKEIFAEFDEFIAMTADENSNYKSDTEEPPFKKITINTDYKIQTSLEEPPTDLELKLLPGNLEYVFLEEPSFLPLLEDKKPIIQKQRRLNPNMQEVVKKEIVKLLYTGIIYPIADSPWVSPIHCVPKKGGIMLGHKVSSARLEVNKAKIDVISKLPPPANIKGETQVVNFEYDIEKMAFADTIENNETQLHNDYDTEEVLDTHNERTKVLSVSDDDSLNRLCQNAKKENLSKTNCGTSEQRTSEPDIEHQRVLFEKHDELIDPPGNGSSSHSKPNVKENMLITKPATHSGWDGVVLVSWFKRGFKLESLCGGHFLRSSLQVNHCGQLWSTHLFQVITNEGLGQVVNMANCGSLVVFDPIKEEKEKAPEEERGSGDMAAATFLCKCSTLRGVRLSLLQHSSKR
nr:reverse transcriptase domain-containing protein [Tanacetum cinerariifolium]